MSNNRNWFPFIRLAGIVLFVVVLLRTDLDELWGWLKQVDAGFVMLALLFQVLLLVFKGWRWYLLNEDVYSKKVVFQRFGEFMEAYAIGVITPGRMGELMKAGHAVGRSQVISKGLLVIAERGLDLSIFFLVAGIVPLLGFLDNIGTGTGLIMMLVSLTGIILSFLILVSPAVVRLVELILRKIRALKSGQGLSLVPRKRTTLASFAIFSLLSNTSAFLSFYFIAVAVMLNLDFFSVTGGVAFAGVINTIPVTIMGLGTRDVTLLFIFEEVSRSQVLAFSGLILLVSQIGGGVIAMLSGQFFMFLAHRKFTSGQKSQA